MAFWNKKKKVEKKVEAKVATSSVEQPVSPE